MCTCTALEIQLAGQTDGSPANRAFACVCNVSAARTIERKDLKSRPGLWYVRGARCGSLVRALCVGVCVCVGRLVVVVG